MNTKRLAALLFGVIVLVVFFRQKQESKEVKPAPAAAVSRAAKKARSAANPVSDEIPGLVLNITRGELKSDVVRDVFRFYNTPVPVPPTPVPVPTEVPLGLYQWPMKPPPTPAPTPIVPPNIPFAAVGLFGPKDDPIVAFEEQGRVFAAKKGDTVEGRFILKTINRESVDFAFVGLPADITRRVQLPNLDARR